MRNVALIGCGNWGKNILRDLISLNCGVHVVDPSPTAREYAETSGALGAYARIEQLPECDGFVVAVPIPSLTPVTLSLLDLQKPVFAEKTLCLSMGDYQLLSRHPESDRVFVMHKWHYHPGVEALRRLAASGELGSLEEVVTTRHAWVNDFHGGDVFWTQAVHDLTIVKHIVGYIPDVIHAVHVVRDDTGLPVSVRAMLGSDPVVVMSVSGHHTSKISSVSIHGPKGTAELRDSLDDAILLRTADRSWSIPIDTEYPLYLELKEFLEYLDGGARPRCGLADAADVTRALLNLRQAADLA
jgi:predicted dehydrogenase